MLLISPRQDRDILNKYQVVDYFHSDQTLQAFHIELTLQLNTHLFTDLLEAILKIKIAQTFSSRQEQNLNINRTQMNVNEPGGDQSSFDIFQNIRDKHFLSISVWIIGV